MTSGDVPRRPRIYWSRRQGITPALTLAQASRLLTGLLDELGRRDYFVEWFGFYCVDVDDVPGRAGKDRVAFVARQTFRDDLWPYSDYSPSWDEAALLTAVEFFHDHVSKGTKGDFHSYNGCGMHWSEFDAETAQAEYRREVNQLLRDYGDGFEIGEDGQVVRRAPTGLDPLLAASLRPVPGKPYEDRVDAAIHKFRSRGSSVEDRRDAVRDLADVLEFLRPEIRRVLTKKDDTALFEIANKFAIRHMDGEQFTDYTKPVWLSWMFYFYLATIHAVAHLVDRRAVQHVEPGAGPSA